MAKALKVSVAASVAMVCLATAGVAMAQTPTGGATAGGGVSAGGTATAGGSATAGGNATAGGTTAATTTPSVTPAPAAQPATATAGGSANGQVGMALPQGQDAPAAAATPGQSDHDSVVGRLAVGYLGRDSMLIGASNGGNSAANRTVVAPIIGIRYWISDLLGIDAGLGLFTTSGSDTVKAAGVSTSIDKQGTTAFMLHAGVPLSLASSGHFSFQITPEANFGFATSTLKPPPGAAPPANVETDFSGLHFDVGARAGAEIQFGFMGIPQLSLEGSLGLLLSIDNYSSTLKTTPETSVSDSNLAISTSVYDNPWNIFTSNVAALYYF